MENKAKELEKLELAEIEWVAMGLIDTYWPVQVRLELYQQFPYIAKFVVDRILSDVVESVRRQKICEKNGHKLVLDGYQATPDTGGEWGHCTHCGWAFDVTYY